MVDLIETNHGVIETPAFVPAAWEGAVPSLDPVEIAQLGASALAVSALQLALRPGVETITSVGGLRTFMGWAGPLLSEAGNWDLASMTAGGQGRVIVVDVEGVT